MFLHYKSEIGQEKKYVKKTSANILLAKINYYASRHALERDEEPRAIWRARLRGWKAEQMLFLDESAACERTGDRKYGWATKREPAAAHSLFKRSKRWLILPAYTVDGYIAFTVHHGSIPTEIFNQFVAEIALPQRTPYADGGPRSIIILDNAKIHISQEYC